MRRIRWWRKGDSNSRSRRPGSFRSGLGSARFLLLGALGHVGITDVITLMGYYTSVSMTLAFYDVPAGAPREWRAEERTLAIAGRSPPVRAVGTGLAIALLQFGSPNIPEIRVPAALIMDP